MSLMAQFVDGQLQTQTASSTSISNKDSNDSGVTSEAFLQLLVAEMQNQDPLEPTSNTEWISQYATFTEVSEIQEISNSMNSVKAQDLVGEYVIMKVTNEKGNTDYVSGQVDYVVYENDDVYLSINGELYSINDLDTVADQRYMDAYSKASDIAEKLKKLPKVDDITLGNKDDIQYIYDTTQEMNDYEKSFLDQTVYDVIDEYHKKLTEITAAQKTLAESGKTDTADTENAASTKTEETKSEETKTEESKSEEVNS